MKFTLKTLPFFPNTIKTKGYVCSVFFVLLPLVTLLALFKLQQSFPILRYINPIGRYVFLIALALFAILIAQDRKWIRKWNVPSWIGALDQRCILIAMFALVLSLCVLPLLISWSNGGTQDYSAIGGLLPYSDAAGYFEGAERLLHDGYLTAWAERRPLNSAFFAARLLLSGDNFYGAMIIQAVVGGTALFLASYAIAKVHGATVALIFFSVCFSFLSGCVYRTLSEPLGISLGLISFAHYWSGIANRNLTQYALGTLVLTLALLTRAGAMFAILASILFAFVFFSESWRRRSIALAATIAAVACAWLINKSIIHMHGTGSGALLSNFSFVLYGLSQGGKSWTQALVDFPQMSSVQESQIAEFLYQKATETILSNPLLLIIGLAKSLFQSILAFPGHIVRLLADASDGGAPWSPIHFILPALALFPALGYGLVRLIFTNRATFSWFHIFLFFQIIGFIASLPFFYHDGGIRLTAATFPFTAAVTALILAALKSNAFPLPSSEILRTNSRASLVVMAAILAASLIAPRIGPFLTTATAANSISCRGDEEQLQMTIGDGSAHINIIDDDGGKPSMLPNIRRSDFLISKINERKKEWETISLPATILMGFDFNAHSLRFIIGPHGFSDGPSKLATLCAIPLNDNIFSHRLARGR